MRDAIVYARIQETDDTINGVPAASAMYIKYSKEYAIEAYQDTLEEMESDVHSLRQELQYLLDQQELLHGLDHEQEVQDND